MSRMHAVGHPRKGKGGTSTKDDDGNNYGKEREQFLYDPALPLVLVLVQAW